jgi:hypothetical protein
VSGKSANPKRKKPGKKPVPGATPESFVSRSPSWAFSIADPEKWRVRDNIDRVWDRFVSFERMSWQQIMSDTKGGDGVSGTKSHFVSVESISKEARFRLDELGLAENQTLFSLRLSGTERVCGVLDSGVLCIVWYDPKHAILEYDKKHT